MPGLLDWLKLAQQGGGAAPLGLLAQRMAYDPNTIQAGLMGTPVPASSMAKPTAGPFGTLAAASVPPASPLPMMAQGPMPSLGIAGAVPPAPAPAAAASEDDDTPDAPALNAKPAGGLGAPGPVAPPMALRPSAAPAAPPAEPSALDKIGNVIGGIYGNGGPGDGLIALGAGLMSGQGVGKGLLTGMNLIAQQKQSATNNQLQQGQLALQQAKLQREQSALQGNANYVKSYYASQGKTISDDEALALAQNPGVVSSAFAGDTKDKNDTVTTVTDPAERAAIGLLPTDNRVVQKDANGKLYFPGAGGVAVNMPPVEKASDQAFGKAEGDEFGAILKSGQSARATQGQIALMRDAFANGGDQISTGPFAKSILGAKQAILNATGIDLGGISEGEAVQKLGFGLATNLTKEISQRPAQQEFLKALENVPGIFMSPQGSKVMMSVLDQQAQQKVDLARLVSNPENRRRWPDVEQAYFDAHPLVSPFTGKPLAATDVDTLAGAAKQAGFDPVTGRAAQVGGAPAGALGVGQSTSINGIAVRRVN